jgi:hypothetical protein
MRLLLLLTVFIMGVAGVAHSALAAPTQGTARGNTGPSSSTPDPMSRIRDACLRGIKDSPAVRTIGKEAACRCVSRSLAGQLKESSEVHWIVDYYDGKLSDLDLELDPYDLFDTIVDESEKCLKRP